MATTTGTLAVALLLAGCSGGAAGPSGDAGASTRATSRSPTGPTSGGTATQSESRATPGSPAPYLPVPRGVVLTDPGSELGVGERGTIAWRARGDDVATLGVVVRKLVRADIKVLADWRLGAARRSSALYYVRISVTNVGDVDLSGQRIPLYVLDGAGALVESSQFETDFAPCPSRAMPAGFVHGEKATLCQAFLVPQHGELKAVAFRPTPRFNPITWVGRQP
jgi:hypothetical protein